MLLSFLKFNICRAAMIQCQLNHEGFGDFGRILLNASNICQNEQGRSWNINNGEMSIPYAIRTARGRRIISFSGSSARRSSAGNLVCSAAFTEQDATAVAALAPPLAFAMPNNAITEQRSTGPVQQP